MAPGRFTIARRQLGGLLLAFGLAAARLPAADATNAAAQPQALTKDELLDRLATQEAELALRQARTEMDRAKVDYEETQRLFDQRITTIDDLNKKRQAHERAVLDFEQAKIKLEKTRLEFLKGATLVTVVEAIKYRDPEGQIMVAVKLSNDSDLAKARSAMSGEASLTDDELKSLLKINNLIVTLRKDGAIIGDPYQQIVTELKYGEQTTLRYQLLKRDAEQLEVAISFLKEEKSYTVFIKKEALQDIPTIASTQFSVQGQLGTKVRYDLQLERLASTEQTFSLVVLNMPEAMSCAFIEPESQSRVTHLKFTEERSTQSLQFEVAIPQKLDPKYVDASIDFTLVVTRPSELPRISELRHASADGLLPAEEIAKIKGSSVSLKLIPTGVGKLDILLANLFKEVKRGDFPVSVKFTLLNSGTLVLRNVTPELSLPLEWEADIDPKSAATLAPTEKKIFTVQFRPPAEVAIGEYPVKLDADGKTGAESVEANPQDFTIRVASESHITGTLVLVGILIALVLAIAVASVRISRR